MYDVLFEYKILYVIEAPFEGGLHDRFISQRGFSVAENF